ncbi:MurR/RpiR family transcriptional regulator [Chelativorans salis]|uniref:MurR/RpiR family transcriptional regulator n=1 Tax=Chelativorans salis TaxID=2978478 RepID=A0ABT2LQN9_9HYPH|nr:MurR/RpiR family transcriptional regulator [Chelativorans sp. EGI FJ00035]MCT7376817.1 MurR/RpiR family transcriptional regulator [Chelativorans sp. EGI FJ00035]
MEKNPLADRLLEEYETMPPRLRAAARFVLEHPAEVAWMSMREQGRRAGVSHSTMIRLAAWLGLDSYDDLRAICAQMRRDPDGPRLRVAVATQQATAKEISMVTGVADSLTEQVKSLGSGISPKRLLAAANILAEARGLFCFGMHSGEMIARHFVHLASQVGKNTALISMVPESGTDIPHRPQDGDAMLVVSFAPHSPVTSKLARQMMDRGVAIVAVTDGKASTLQRIARENIIVPTKLHSCFPSATTALAATEFLAALTAEKMNANAGRTRGQREAELAILEG